MKKLLLIVLLAYNTTAFTQGWHELGVGSIALNANSWIGPICADKNGNIYSAGGFTDSNGKYYVAKWDGSTWSELGIGNNGLNANGPIFALCNDTMGNIYAAGYFTNSNGKYYVAKWDGSKWYELGSGSNSLNAGNIIYTICADKNGKNIYAGGNFGNYKAGKSYVARWDGKSWSELGNTNPLDATNSIYSIIIDSIGNVYVAGEFGDSNGDMFVAKWDGKSWSKVGNGNNALQARQGIHTICFDKFGNLYAAGSFINSNWKRYVAKWDGSNWSQVGTDFDGDIFSMCTDSAGNIYATGYINYVSKWNGNSWSELGAGNCALNANHYINSVCNDANGNIYAAGNFTNSNGKSYVAKYTSVTLNPINITACNSYNFNGDTLNSSGIYYDTITINCFDSIIILNLTLIKSTSNILNITSCNEYNFNGQLLKKSGVYYHKLTNSIGCDSNITLNLTINSIDKSVSQINNILFANEQNAQYHWLDCNNAFSFISGETGQMFKASKNGSYAVIVTKAGCIDTSACYAVNNTEITSEDKSTSIQLYPNPITTIINIQHISNKKEDLTIYNILGEVLYKNVWQIGETQKSIDMSSFTKGIYIIRVGDVVQKIVKE